MNADTVPLKAETPAPAQVDAQKLWINAKNDAERAAIVKAHPQLAEIYAKALELKQP